MKNNGIFISFIGSRGSGKTTVADIVCDKLNQSGVSCLRQHPGFKRRPFWRGISTAIYLWRFFDFKMIIYFGFMGRKKRILPSMYRLYLPLALAHDLHKLSNKKSEVLLYDSNILRGLISAIASNEVSDKEIVDLYKNKVLSKVGEVLFIVIDTDPAESVSRWVARDNISLSDSEYSNAVSERIKSKNEADVVVKLLASLPQIKIIHLNGSTLPDENAAKVVDLLLSRRTNKIK